MRIGRVVVRLIIGGLFIGHGTQKLFGWFGGPGLAGTEQMMSASSCIPRVATPSPPVPPKPPVGRCLPLGWPPRSPLPA